MENFTFTFKLEEINLILEALGNIAYKKSVKVIAGIHEQAEAQQKAKQEEEVPQKGSKAVKGELVD